MDQEQALREILEVADNTPQYAGKHENAMRLNAAMDKVAALAREALTRGGVRSW